MTKVRHNTSKGVLTYGNPEGVESDLEVAEAERAYRTKESIEQGTWRGLRIYVGDVGYELVLTQPRNQLEMHDR